MKTPRLADNQRYRDQLEKILNKYIPPDQWQKFVVDIGILSLICVSHGQKLERYIEGNRDDFQSD